MSRFCLLDDPAAYSVGDVDLVADAEARRYWLKLFEDHFAMVLDSALTAHGRGRSRHAESARRQFAEAIKSLREDPRPMDGRLGVVELCRLREKVLGDNGLGDPFKHVKERENLAAAGMYPSVVRRITSMPVPRRWEHLVRGVLAGNVFDLGSIVTMGYARDRMDFDAAVGRVKPRPWAVDEFDRLDEMLPADTANPAPWAKAVVFVDNAGADFILGVMPFVRHLAAHGTQVVLAANESPSLNDITADETVQVVQQLSDRDEELAGYVSAGLFEVVSTGNDIPLIDLSEVSDELNEAAAGADLVLLEGMGRSVESNYHTKFAVDSIQLCTLKDPSIASRVGAEVFDCVCVYRPVE